MSNFIMQLTNINLQVNNIANQIQGLLQGIQNNFFNANLIYNISFQIFSIGTQMFNIGIQSNNIGIDFNNINQKMMNLEFEINKMKINFQNSFPMMNNFPIINNNFPMMNQEKLDLGNNLNPKNIEVKIFNICFENITAGNNVVIPMNGGSTIGETIRKYIREHTDLSEDIARKELKFIHNSSFLGFDSKEKLEKICSSDNPTIEVYESHNIMGG